MTEKYIESLQKSLKSAQIADHMLYITFPVVKDKRLFLKILEHISESIVFTINAILQYDYLWKKISLYKDPKSNFSVFIEECAPRYNITREQIKEIKDILAIIEKHKKSPIEFSRSEKIVIMSDDLNVQLIDIEKVKNYLLTAKRLFQTASLGLSGKG